MSYIVDIIDDYVYQSNNYGIRSLILTLINPNGLRYTLEYLSKLMMAFSKIAFDGENYKIGGLCAYKISKY